MPPCGVGVPAEELRRLEVRVGVLPGEEHLGRRRRGRTVTSSPTGVAWRSTVSLPRLSSLTRTDVARSW